MKPILIDTQSEERQEEEITRIREEMSVSPFDIHPFTPAPSLGIADVREIQRRITRKPFQGEIMLLILYAMEKATIEAQNALLKILEEPPTSVQFILTTHNRHALLPTILSRCTILTYREKQKVGADLFDQITSSSIGKRILLSQELAKSKEDTLLVLRELAHFLQYALENRETMFPPIKLAKTLQKIEQGKQLVEKNINYKAILDLLFISFPAG